MSSTTHRRFDPWRTAPVQEMSRREILQTHCFNIDQVAFDSLAGEPFERDFIHVKHGDTAPFSPSPTMAGFRWSSNTVCPRIVGCWRFRAVTDRPIWIAPWI